MNLFGNRKIHPEPPSGRSKGAPEDEPQRAKREMVRQGFLPLGFGIAAAIALEILYALAIPLFKTNPLDESDFLQDAISALTSLEPWLPVPFGLVGGVIIAFVYNLMLERQSRAFGLDNELQ